MTTPLAAPATPPSPFDRALTFVLAREGFTFTTDPHDAGGPTKYGITQSTFSEYLDDIEAKPRSVATITVGEVRAIYDRQYWRLCGAPALVAAGRPQSALLAMDWAVHGGVARARAYVQAACGAAVDGIWGEKTLHRISVTPDLTLTSQFQILRAHHYRLRCGELDSGPILRAAGIPPRLLPTPNPSQRRYLKGWLRRLRLGCQETGTAIASVMRLA